MGVFDLIPLDENLRPFLPLALSKLGVSINDVNILNSMFDMIVRLKDAGEVNKVGDLLAHPEISAFIAELQQQQAAKTIEQVDKDESVIATSNQAKFKVFLCPRCRQFSYMEDSHV